MQYRKALAANIDEMTTLLLTEGPNQWNYLPEDEVREHLHGIANGTTHAFLCQDGPIVGFVSYNIGVIWPKYEPEELKQTPHGYLAEAVTHHDYRGENIGPDCAQMAIEDMVSQGVNRIYVIRHEENAASARLMEKTGFEVVDTFYDPVRRQTGTRRTTVCRLVKR